ncbi:MAG: cell division protein FtsL [Coxiellaceae bacterium]|nr:cell division protein FtsL [Coxiellaceae bacterium]
MRLTIRSAARAKQRLNIPGLIDAIKSSWLTIFLVLSIVISAFTLIYVKDLNRRLFIESQSLQAQHQKQTNQWGKLLLEQSTWSAQSRVQSIAQQNLQMVMPSAKSIVLLGGFSGD